MSVLYNLRLVDRSRPRLDVGSAPHHYVLDHAGWIITSSRDTAKLKWSAEKALSISHSQHLTHRVGVNRFFCKLKRAERDDPRYRLTQCWTERRCKESCGGLVFPDGYGQWRNPGGELSFFLEYDRGTEPLDRLVRKLDGYRQLSKLTRPIHVLFVFESYGRELSARAALTKAGGVTFATMTLAADTRPHEGVWWQGGLGEGRRLEELRATLPD